MRSGRGLYYGECTVRNKIPRPAVTERGIKWLLHLPRKSSTMVTLPTETDQHQAADPNPTAVQVRNHHGFLPWELVHFSLPYRPVDAAEWTRTNGDASVTITPGAMRMPDGSIQTHIPSGKLARAALLFLCTEAKLSGSRRIDVATSYRGYLKQLGVSWQHANAVAAVHQLRALCASTITVSSLEQENSKIRVRAYRATFSSEESLFFATEAPQILDENMRSEIVLSEDLFESIKSSTPINLQAWRYLLEASKSPLVLDLYTWLAARLFTLKGIQRIPWKNLAQQFGSSGSEEHFRRSFKDALNAVWTVYPEANVTIVGAGQRQGFRGVMLQPSPNALDAFLP